MSTEFITLDSRLTYKRNAISERKLKHGGAGNSPLFTTVTVALGLLVLDLYLVLVEEKYYYIPFFFLVIFWLLPYAKKLYAVIFIQSWKNSISIKDVREVTTLPLDNGLETQVTLHLASGRKKIYIFRDAESQLEGFLQLFDPAGLGAVSPA